MLLQRIKILGARFKTYWRILVIKFYYDSRSVVKYYRKLGISIGEDCRIYPMLPLSEAGLIRIGNHVTITHGVVLVTHDGGTWVLRKKYHGYGKPGPITIKDNCFIGINAIILPNVSIGPNSIVGAGTVVTRDVQPNTVVAGVPAKVIRTLEEYEKKLLKDPSFRTWSSNN